MISDLLMHSSNVEVQGRFLRGCIATLGTLIVPYLVMDSFHASWLSYGHNLHLLFPPLSTLNESKL